MERASYYIDLYEVEVPPERQAPSFSQERSGRSQSRTHTRTVSTEGVEGPRRFGPYDKPPSTHRSSRSHHHLPSHSGHGSNGSSR